MIPGKSAIASALLIAAMGITAGTSNAAEDNSPDNPAVVNFTARATDKQSIITIDSGALVAEDGVLKIEDNNGTVLAGTPLRFRVDDFEFPIAAEISGRTATLTPLFDMANASYRPVWLPFEDQAPFRTDYDREMAAWARMTSTIGLGVTLGTLIGGIGGGAVGCLLGGLAGATVASATIVGMFGPFLPAALVGCIGGIIAIGALGTLAGQIFITTPIAIAAVIQYFTTANEPHIEPPKSAPAPAN